MRALILAAALVLTGCAAPAAPAQLPPPSLDPAVSQAATVFRDVDGDTIKIDGGKRTVRILGIDSPETKDPRKPVQCGGPESSAWAAQQLPPGTPIILDFEPNREQHDRYDRTLAYVMYQRGGQGPWLDFGVESALAGHARNYIYDKRPVSRQAEIAAAESKARQARTGLWACPGNSASS